MFFNFFSEVESKEGYSMKVKAITEAWQVTRDPKI